MSPIKGQERVKTIVAGLRGNPRSMLHSQELVEQSSLNSLKTLRAPPSSETMTPQSSWHKLDTLQFQVCSALYSNTGLDVLLWLHGTSKPISIWSRARYNSMHGILPEKGPHVLLPVCPSRGTPLMPLNIPDTLRLHA